MTRPAAALLPAALVLLTGILTVPPAHGHPASLAPAILNTATAAATSAPAGAWLRIDTDAGTLRQRHGLQPAGDYGRFQWLPADGVDVGALRASGLAVTVVPDAFVLDLGGERFDPLAAGHPTLDGGSGEQADWHLVQFNGPIRQGWLDDLQAGQVQPVQYIHPYSYVVWSTPQALATAAARSADVRWAGHFRPEYRINPMQRGHGRSVIATMALISRHADEGQVRTALAEAGAQVNDITPVNRDFAVVDMAVAGDRYLALAEIPAVYTVQYIRPEAGPRGEMSNQSIVGNYGPSPSHTVFPGYEDWLIGTGYDGTGVVVGIVDGGVRTSHNDLAGQFLPCIHGGGTRTSCSSANDSHGTHVAGAVAGTGASGTRMNGFLRGQGVAPGAKMIEQRYNPLLGSGPGGMHANGMLTIFRESALSGAQLANNSWGPAGSPQGYDIPTQQMDIISRDALADEPGQQPVLAVWSIMNGDGDWPGSTCAPSSLGSPDEAKNLFAVGSTSMQSGSGGAQAGQIFNVSANSAHGNACDGRRVPHIVAPGCSTDSTSSGSNSAYGFSCGTSMASPVVSGAAAVYIEKYRAENDGHTPSPALVKAAFTAVAKDLQGYRNASNAVMGHRPDRFQGYGRLQLDRVLNPAQPVLSVDQTVTLHEPGEFWMQTLQAADPAEPVQIMLAWTDAKGHGLGGSTPAWVNDLDLIVDSAGGFFRGNVIGSDGWSATGGSADPRNNLEGVFLTPEQHGGEMTLVVQATNIAADALDPYEPGAVAQDFALVCYNCVEATPAQPQFDLGLTMIDVPDPVAPGAELAFVVQVANFGPDNASQVQVDLQLPAALQFDLIRVRDADSQEYLDPAASPWSCASGPGQAVNCQLASTLTALAMAPVLEVVTRVDAGTPPGSIQTSAQVGADGIELEPANNTVTLDTQITGPVDVIFRNGFEHVVYLHDDGDGNTNQGPPSSFDPDMLWGNYYLTEPGGDVITQISVAFGPTFPSLADGPVTFWLLDDPDMDLDPRNATALVSVQGTPDVVNDTFFTVSIPPTRVSGAFFVGASAKLLGGEDKPARVDTGGPGATSWFFYAPEIADVIDDLASAPFGARMDDTQYVVFPGAFMVRATGVSNN